MPCLVTTSDDEEIAGVREGEESGVQKGSRAGQPRTANLTPPWAVVSGKTGGARLRRQSQRPRYFLVKK